MIRWLRSLAFHICYFGWNILAPLLFFWAPFTTRAMTLRMALVYARLNYWLERHVMGLDYRVLHAERLPSRGPYLVAMKHQSVWETLKLLFLFPDAAIVLKRELTWIPIWGWFLAKLDLIPVDRGARGVALRSMLDGARHVTEQGRPIVIFPQGTRVAPGAAKPYRYGLFRLYRELNLPVVPVALNSGVFWGKNQFLKRSGIVTVEIMETIPAGLSEAELAARLIAPLEAASDRLVQQAGGPALKVTPEEIGLRRQAPAKPDSGPAGIAEATRRPN